MDGGIYDRCINNNSYSTPHRINEIKKQVHQISRNIAIWMFEKNPDKASISHEEYIKICNCVMQESEIKNKNIRQDFLISNYFKLVKHCEGLETKELYFVHRSIYEYFVAETIYSSIENIILSLSNKNQEELSGTIALYLKEGEITYIIGEYLKCKILKLYNRLDTIRKNMFFGWWECAIANMMKHGMFFYTKKNIKEYDNILMKEAICFRNLTYILTLLQSTNSPNKFIMQNNKEYFQKYVKLYTVINQSFEMNEKKGLGKLILKKFDLSMCDFSYTYLADCDLSEANLSGTNFYRAMLANVKVTGAIFNNTNLGGADVQGVNFKNIDLQNTNLKGANLSNTNLRGTILGKYNLYEVDISNANYI